MVEVGLVLAILAVVFALYICTSLVLLKFPNILHKRKNIKFQARHISHRGGAGENLENTMTAFRHAYNVGTDMLEIDCHMTKDGEVVVSHDNSLKRCSGVDASISDLNFSDLPPLCDKLRVDFSPTHTTECSCNDREIPLLRDVFSAFPNIPLNIDIKRDDQQLIEKVSSLVSAFNREHITVWGNASRVITDKLYTHNSNIPLLFSFRRVMILLACFYTGLLPFVPLKESFFETLMPSILIRGKQVDETSFTWRIFVSLFDWLLMRPALFEHLRKRGIQTYVFVLNDEYLYHRAFQLGASGVMTDDVISDVMTLTSMSYVSPTDTYVFVLNDEYLYHRAFQLGASGVMTDFPTKLQHFLTANPQYCIPHYCD